MGSNRKREQKDFLEIVAWTPAASQSESLATTGILSSSLFLHS